MKRLGWLRDGRGGFFGLAVLVAMRIGLSIGTSPLPRSNILGLLVAIAIVALAGYGLSRMQWRQPTDAEKRELRAAQEGRGLGMAVMLGLYALGIALIVGVALLARFRGNDDSDTQTESPFSTR